MKNCYWKIPISYDDALPSHVQMVLETCCLKQCIKTLNEQPGKQLTFTNTLAKVEPSLNSVEQTLK